MASLEGMGMHVFRGAIAAPYLARQGLPPDTIDHPDWAKDSRADKVSFQIIFFRAYCLTRFLNRLLKLF
jgi:hypothetical protein